MDLIANYREPVSKWLGSTSLPGSFQVKAFFTLFCSYKRGLPVKKHGIFKKYLIWSPVKLKLYLFAFFLSYIYI